jgi:hypothetical protein
VIPYNLAPGASSDPITVAADTPVFIIANNTTPGEGGTGSISVQHRAGYFLEWSGVNSIVAPSTATPPTLTGGYGPGLGGAPVGTKMLAIDYSGTVTLQLADADHFVIHNGSGLTQTGVLWILTPPT